MAQVFIFDTPEQLRDAFELIKAGSADAVARVWSATRRRNGGRSDWDGRIVASFFTSGRTRRAVIGRVSLSGEPEEVAALKYGPALSWCREHMRRAE